MKKDERKELEHFLKEFKKYKDQGVKFVLDGQETSLETVAKVCVIKERGTYMGDYIGDETGNLIAIHFDKVEEEE